MRRIVDKHHSRHISVAENSKILDVGHPRVHFKTVRSEQSKRKEFVVWIKFVEQFVRVVFLTCSENPYFEELAESLKNLRCVRSDLEVDLVLSVISHNVDSLAPADVFRC